MLGENIRKIRKSKQISINLLSKKAKISLGYLSDLENGKSTNPTTEILQKIADALEVSPDRLLGESVSSILETRLRKSNMTLKDLAERLHTPLVYLKSLDVVIPDEYDYAKIEQIAGILKMSPNSLRAALARQEPPGYDGPISALEEDFNGDVAYGVPKDEIPRAFEESQLYKFDDMQKEIAIIPVLGHITAGQPILAEEHILGYEKVPASQVKGGQFFYLKVQGDSMSNAGIYEGDLVLVRKQPTINHKDIAVVMVNSHDATVKRVYKANDHLVLQPENPDYEPIIVKNDSARIIGKVVALTRNF